MRGANGKVQILALTQVCRGHTYNASPFIDDRTARAPWRNRRSELEETHTIDFANGAYQPFGEAEGQSRRVAKRIDTRSLVDRSVYRQF
jgi:hypothetical protein